MSSDAGTVNTAETPTPPVCLVLCGTVVLHPARATSVKKAVAVIDGAVQLIGG